jgi:hypothetical protein
VLRWWAILVVGIAWAIVIAFIQPTAVVAGGLLGVANAVVGVLPAVALRRRIVNAMPTLCARPHVRSEPNRQQSQSPSVAS